MRVCPTADPTDGLLDVTVVGPLSRAAFVRVFPSVYRGECAIARSAPCVDAACRSPRTA